jgi:hypothetical protein
LNKKGNILQIDLIKQTKQKESKLSRGLNSKRATLTSVETNPKKAYKHIKYIRSLDFDDNNYKQIRHRIKCNILDAKEIEISVNNQAELTIERILGSPNKKLSTVTEWHYGNKLSLAIKMSGNKRVLWHNFETEESGIRIKLIKKEMGLSFKGTLKYIANLSGITKLYTEKTQQIQQTRWVVKERNSSNIDVKDVRTKDYAIKLVKESQPINGTIVEKYLKEIRGIKETNSSDIIYHPKVYTGKDESQKYLPAVLSIGRDKDG